MTYPPYESRRTLELLADHAVGHLSDEDRAELETALGDRHDDSMERAAAAAAVAMIAREIEDPPRHLYGKLARQAAAFVQSMADRSAQTVSYPFTHARDVSRDWRRLAIAGWIAAAACLVVAGATWWPRLAGSGEAAPGAARERLLAAGAASASWSEWFADGQAPEIRGVTGDVVWSEREQRGYLRLVGLPRLDAGRQYQLWIIDKRGLTDASGQSARISGAIFDGAPGETIVPIDPAIPVRDASAFGVTIEPAGGVWASDMSRRVVIASLDN